MRKRSAVRRDLARLDNALGAFGESDPTVITGVEVMRVGLKAEHDRLLEELTRTELGDFKVVLDGSAVTGGGADVDQIVRTLGPLQRALDSIGQAIEETPTSAGLVQQTVTSQTRLRLLATAPGSFGLILDGPPPSDQLNLIDVDEPSLIERSLDKVLAVLDAARSADDFEQAIVDEVADLGSRVTAHLIQLADAVARVDVPTQFVWRAPEADDDRIVSVDAPAAYRLRDVLEATDSQERVLEISGVLAAADTITRTFKIRTQDDDVYSGSVDPDLLHRLHDYFDRQVDATLVARTMTSTISGKTATKYRLTAFTGPLN